MHVSHTGIWLVIKMGIPLWHKLTLGESHPMGSLSTWFVIYWELVKQVQVMTESVGWLRRGWCWHHPSGIYQTILTSTAAVSHNWIPSSIYPKTENFRLILFLFFCYSKNCYIPIYPIHQYRWLIYLRKTHQLNNTAEIALIVSTVYIIW